MGFTVDVKLDISGLKQLESPVKVSLRNILDMVGLMVRFILPLVITKVFQLLK